MSSKMTVLLTNARDIAESDLLSFYRASPAFVALAPPSIPPRRGGGDGCTKWAMLLVWIRAWTGVWLRVLDVVEAIDEQSDLARQFTYLVYVHPVFVEVDMQ